MNQVAVVYWSGTGNTEAMAKAVAEGAQSAGAAATVFEVGEFTPAQAAGFDTLAFGCPAMGSEELEEEQFRPLWDSCKPVLTGKQIVLFGSYGWGDGEWMESWKEEAPCQILDTYICVETPGDEELASCRALGEKLA